jgi:hypothetical protein
LAQNTEEGGGALSLAEEGKSCKRRKRRRGTIEGKNILEYVDVADRLYTTSDVFHGGPLLFTPSDYYDPTQKHIYTVIILKVTFFPKLSKNTRRAKFKVQ